MRHCILANLGKASQVTAMPSRCALPSFFAGAATWASHCNALAKNLRGLHRQLGAAAQHAFHSCTCQEPRVATHASTFYRPGARIALHCYSVLAALLLQSAPLAFLSYSPVAGSSSWKVPPPRASSLLSHVPTLFLPDRSGHRHTCPAPAVQPPHSLLSCQPETLNPPRSHFLLKQHEASVGRTSQPAPGSAVGHRGPKPRRIALC